ncbi:MAG: hypothetical protein QOJ79_1601 [Actinomycetota bacterium]|nr:hypothetical protein [Actinomycetota bacterium]
MSRHAVAGWLAAFAVGLGSLPLSPAGAAAATPAAAAGTFTVTPLTFAVTVGPPTARHSCTVEGDLRIPSTASTASPAPALLMTNGFGGSRLDTGPNGNGAYGARFAELGYVTLSYSGLGFGLSSCDITIDDPAIDGQAASQLVSFLGGAPGIATSAGVPYAIPGLVIHDATDHTGVPQQYDPRVGKIGGSSGGEIQFAVAGIDPRVDALAPTYTWNDLGYSIVPNNVDQTGVRTATPGADKYQWQSLFFGLGLYQAAVTPEVAPPSTCPGTRIEMCQANIEAHTVGYPSQSTVDFFRSVSVSSYIDKIKIPVLLSQGENDTLFNLQEAIATFRQLRAQGTPVRMVWQSWGHSYAVPVDGELDPGTTAPGTGTLADTYQGRIFIDWFAHWLRDVPNDLGPDVRYFRDYAYTAPPAGATTEARLAAATAAYSDSPSYPVAPPTAMRLSGGSALVPATNIVAVGSQTFAQPGGNTPVGYSETSSLGAYGGTQTESPGTFAAWSTAPLTVDTDLAGVPTLDVALAAPAAATSQTQGTIGQLVLYAKLYDVDTNGFQSLIHLLISPIRIVDVTKPLHIELPGIVHRFSAGHRIRLVLAAGDSAYKGNVAPSTVTIADGPNQLGKLTLPLVTQTDPTAVVPEVPLLWPLPLLAGGIFGLIRRRRRRAA